MFLTDKIWTFASNPDKNEEFSSQCLSKSPKRLQLPNVCLKIKSQNKNSCRPAAGVVEFFAETLSLNTPAKKLTITQEKTFSISMHQYWVIYHFNKKKGELARMEPARKLVEKG